MDTIICDITAFDYWRIPPIVQLLLAGNETDPVLTKLFKEETVLATREAMASSPLCQTWLRPNPATRNIGRAAKDLMPAISLLAASHRGPIDISVDDRTRCYTPGITRPRFSANDMPFGSTTPIGENLQVANLPFTLLQLAARASLTRVIMLATEACGSFTIYQAPQPIKDALQTCVRNRRFPVVGGWEPFIDGNGCLTDLWTRPAPTTAQELSRMTLDAAPKRGCERLRVAASLVKPDAASPFEARAGILLGLPRQHGGEGHAGLSFNKRINLSSKAKTLAHRSFCLCDLYWEEGLDVECQSTLVHNKANSFLSDSDRTTALRNMGIDVLPLTYDQLKSEARFAAFSETVANIRGKRLKPKTAQIRDAQPGSVGFAAEGGMGRATPEAWSARLQRAWGRATSGTAARPWGMVAYRVWDTSARRAPAGSLKQVAAPDLMGIPL